MKSPVLAFILLLTLFKFNHGKSISTSINLQRITFYSNEDYTGDSESFSQNVPNVQETNGVSRTAKSFCVEKGV